METQCRKEYVAVNLDVDKNGTVSPRFIRWPNGQIFQSEWRRNPIYRDHSGTRNIFVQ